MDFIDRDELKKLLEHASAPCVSLFMPASGGGSESHQQDPICFKNLLAAAEQALAAKGIKPHDSRDLLAPLRRLLDDNDFWTHQGDGLAVFVAPGVCRTYCLPLRLETSVRVGSRFVIKPLLPLLTINSRFWLLALSQKNLRLFRCTRHSYREVELASAPTSLDAALRFDDLEKQMSPGGDDAERREALARYLQAVEAGVRDVLRDSQSPLLLAGVEHVVAKYREVNTYPHLVDAAVLGSTDDKNKHVSKLHEAAWEKLEPLLKKARGEAADLYRQYKGQGKERVSADIGQVLAAAFGGRVETLFISRRRQVWGEFDPTSQELALAEGEGNGAVDLLDLAAGQTLLSNGRVYASDEALPDDSPIAALYRW